MINYIPIKDIQSEILVVSKYLDSICSKYGIKYWLMGGTALGAIRHSGFIPWDDDFDVFLTNDQYERLLAALKIEVDSKIYYINEEGTPEWPLFFSKLRTKRAIYLERHDLQHNVTNGLFVDIMRLCNGYDNIILRYVQYIAGRFLSSYGLLSRGYVGDTYLKRIALKISNILRFSILRRVLHRFVINQNNINSEYLVHFFGRAEFGKACYKRSLFQTTTRVLFEDALFPVPGGVYDYLRVRFGPAYMNLPSQNEISKFPSHCVYYKKIGAND